MPQEIETQAAKIWNPYWESLHLNQQAVQISTYAMDFAPEEGENGSS
jgi:hypothetical protein